MLQAVLGSSGNKFNPTGFVADEHHANWTSIRNVFGAAVVNRMVSCEFHFKQSVQRHAKYLKPSDASDFICLAEKMLTAVIMSDFNDICQSMQQFVQDHDCLKDWYGWWYKRRMHIFRATTFTDPTWPRSAMRKWRQQEDLKCLCWKRRKKRWPVPSDRKQNCDCFLKA